MSAQSINLADRIVGDWITEHMGPMGYDAPNLPGITFNGGIEDATAAFNAIKASDPAWFGEKINRYQTQYGGGASSLTGTGPGDMLTYQGAPKTNALMDFLEGPLFIAKVAAGAHGLANLTGLSSTLGAIPPAYGAPEGFQTLSGAPLDASWGVNQQLLPPGDAYDRLMTGQDMQLGTDMSNLATSGGGLTPWIAPAAAGAAGAAGAGGASGAGGAAAAGAAAVGAGNGGIDDGALSKILNDGGPNAGLLKGLAAALGVTPGDLSKMFGSGLAGVIGAYASGVQGDQLREIANQQMAAEKARYEDLVRRDAERFQTLTQREDAAIARQRADIDFARGITQPSRDRYEATYKPGFTLSSDPGFMDALSMAGKSAMHGMSVQGNPAGNPNAWEAVQKDVYDKVAYPALKDYRTINAATGGYSGFTGAASTVPGIGTNLSGSTSTGSGSTNSQQGFQTLSGAVGSDANVWNSLGAATNSIFNPPQTLAQQLADFKRLAA